MSPAPTLQPGIDGSFITVFWPGGRSSRYHAVWLRDHGQDAASRDPGNGQKKLSATDIPSGLCIRGATLNGSRLKVSFDDGSLTWLDLDWLRRHAYDRTDGETLIPKGRKTWAGDLDADGVMESFPRIADDPAVLGKWLRWVDTLGFARLRDVPAVPGAVLDVIALFGFVRETNYGRLFEVRSEPDPVNLAYTRMGLDPHTDNPYRDPVPTLQFLHCLENSAGGGESNVVDGFRVAEILRREDPDRFALLSRYNVTFRYCGDGRSDLTAHRPMLEVSPDGQLVQVRINSRSFQSLTGVPYDLVPDFYAAYRHLEEITRRPEVSVTFRMEPGELFVVDNTRVLHGRGGFTKTGLRWLQGAYADIDGLRSTLALLGRRHAA